MTVFICKFCARETTNPGANKKHENSCKKNPNPKVYVKSPLAGSQIGRVAWNKGLTKEKDHRVAHKEETKEKFRGENNPFFGKKHSEETKRKISTSRKKFIDENPHMSPWVYSHYTKRKSYAERYWKKIFVKSGIGFEEQYPVSRYCLDFAIPELKIDVEIDGEQHYTDERIIESDKRRNEYLEALGWKVIRIRWADYKRLSSKEEKRNFVGSIIQEITASLSGLDGSLIRI